MIKAGVIGYGLGGMAFHAPLIDAAPGLELAAIATSRVDSVRERYPDVTVTSTEALIADPSIALVAISTPNDTHFPLAKAALEAGKHVVIDKPFATSVADAVALDALAREKKLVLAAFHNRRWDGDFLTIREVLASAVLGDVMLAELRWDRFRPEIADIWKEREESGAGILNDLGPHLIDQAIQLFGVPESIATDVLIQRPGAQTDDYFELTFHYGVRRVVVSASRMVTRARPRFAIHGSKGSFVKHGLDPQEMQMKEGMRPGTAGFGEEPVAQRGSIYLANGTVEIVPTRPGDYRNFYAGMAAAITEGTPPPVTPADAILGLKIIELARKNTGQGCVRINAPLVGE
ncbi:oxidoreductase [Sphingomonas sp. dw_22]|uniref:oxidoreductase n=1 Tax=Sphingomonas sp. dw_22 TaxID=2721175 RepID=UPI001BD20FD5|nr:oxidoreductase [Sphingomonas sp. dw_22]